MDNYNMRIKYLINKSCEIMFRNENVIGFGRGRKWINGYDSKIPSITVFVKKKLPKNMLKPYELIPQIFYGASTDVVELGVVSYHNRGKVRPLLGGLAIGLSRVDEYGTLGYFVIDRATKKKLYLLSNEHILGNQDSKASKDVLQPPTIWGGTFSTAKIATVEKSILQKPRIKGNNTVFNEVDAAIAYIGPNIEIIQKTIAQPQMFSGGMVKGIMDADIDDEVRKDGATTRLTTGIVKTLDTTIVLEGYLYKNQIITTTMSEKGDSGSLGIIIRGSKAFGLLMGGGVIGTIYNPIDKVLDALDVDIAMPIMEM